MSRDCCVALCRGAMGLSQFVIVVFPDHTNLLFLWTSFYGLLDSMWLLFAFSLGLSGLVCSV